MSIEAEASVGDLLVRGGTVIDGTGSPGRLADVRVREGRITEVGRSLAPAGELEVDARGAVVAPGFIENHAHVDPSLFWDPFCDPSPQHGVTTMLAGNCSLSLFPMHDSLRADAIKLFALIEDVPAVALEQGVPWCWTGYDEYRDRLAKGGLGLNVATLVGHSILRWFVMGEAGSERVATREEVAAMCEVLDASIRAGAFGLSSSFGDKDHLGRPVPSCWADDAEFAALFDVLARHGALFEFLPNLSGGTAPADIERVAALTKTRGVVSTWNTIGQSRRAPERAAKFLEQASRLQADGVKMYPQSSPRTFDLRIGWTSSVLFNDMPQGWARAIRAGNEEKKRLLADPEWRNVARKEWDAAKLSPFPTWDIARIRFLTVTRPENERWVGKTLADLVAERGGHGSDALADWVLVNDLDPGVLATGVNNDDAEAVGRILRHPSTLVGASDNGAHVAMFCAAGDTTLLLTRHVRERGDMTLESAVHELTGRQASTLGFAGRGVIAPGKIGDLVIFALDELRWETDAFVNDLPGGGSRLRRPPGGYRHTIVGGRIVQTAGELTGARPGRPIGIASYAGGTLR